MNTTGKAHYHGKGRDLDHDHEGGHESHSHHSLGDVARRHAHSVDGLFDHEHPGGELPHDHNAELEEGRRRTAALMVEGLIKAGVDYDGDCPGSGLMAPCPACDFPGWFRKSGEQQRLGRHLLRIAVIAD